MAIVFSLRGDSLAARFSNNGSAGAGLGGTPPTLVSDATTINGVNAIDLSGAGLGYKGIAFPGDTNTPSGRPRSMLFRVKFSSTGAQGIGGIGGFHRNPINFIGLSLTATPEVTVTIANHLNQVDTGTTSSSGIGTSAWHDIGVSWDGTSDASKMLVAVDSVIKLTDTMTRFLPATFNANERKRVFNTLVGPNYTANNVHFLLDEMIVWDTEIDFTANQVLDGTDAKLVGAARTGYLTVNAFDGLAASQGSKGFNL